MDKVIHWKEFIIPNSKRTISCTVSGENDKTCHMKLDGPFSDYTLLIKNEIPHLLSNITGKLYNLKPLSTKANRYGIKSVNGSDFINFDIDSHEDKTTVTIPENGGYLPKSHKFNFYKNHNIVTMDKEHVPSIFKYPSKLRIGNSYGYGVFASADIKNGELLEEAPMLSQEESFLSDYTFGFEGKHLISLGFGSLYNHADEPNVGHSINLEGDIISFHALKDIPEGTQCTISYGPGYFSTRGIIAEKIE